jgi:hypothetical protein
MGILVDLITAYLSWVYHFWNKEDSLLSFVTIDWLVNGGITFLAIL